MISDTDAIVEQILTSYDTITVVGASASAAKAAHGVPAYMQRHGWRIIPVNPHADNDRCTPFAWTKNAGELLTRVAPSKNLTPPGTS